MLLTIGITQCYIYLEYISLPTNVKLVVWDITVTSRLSTHSFKYTSWLSLHFLANFLGFKIY